MYCRTISVWTWDWVRCIEIYETVTLRLLNFSESVYSSNCLGTKFVAWSNRNFEFARTAKKYSVQSLQTVLKACHRSSTAFAITYVNRFVVSICQRITLFFDVKHILAVDFLVCFCLLQGLTCILLYLLSLYPSNTWRSRSLPLRTKGLQASIDCERLVENRCLISDVVRIWCSSLLMAL